MKIKILTKYKTKLLKLKLLKTKIYKKEKAFNYLLLKNLETQIKKVLHIIYKFHIANKKILFIGTSTNLNNKIKQFLKHTKHSFIPTQVWINGIITNPKASFKYLLKQHNIFKNKSFNFLFNLKNQIDLIVILNEELNIDALKESMLKRVPIISLNSQTNIANYKISSDFNFEKKSLRHNLFFLLLNSLLKKAEILKKKSIQKVKKQKKFNNFTQLRNRVNSKKNVFSKK